MFPHLAAEDERACDLSTTVAAAGAFVEEGCLTYLPNEYFTEETSYNCILVHKILPPEANYTLIKLRSCQTGPNCFQIVLLAIYHS